VEGRGNREMRDIMVDEEGGDSELVVKLASNVEVKEQSDEERHVRQT
jgi:hypothetical protein